MNKKIEITLIKCDSDSVFFGTGFLRWTIAAAEIQKLKHLTTITSQIEESEFVRKDFLNAKEKSLLVVDMRGDARLCTTTFIEEIQDRLRETCVVQVIVLHDGQWDRVFTTTM